MTWPAATPPVALPAGARPARAQARYLLGGAALVVLYAVLVTVLWTQRGWSEDGPLSFHSRSASEALDDRPLAEVGDQCAETGQFTGGKQVKIVGARIDDVVYYACYQVNPDGAVFKATVIDPDGLRAPTSVIKDGGAWRWIGQVKTTTELVLGGAGVAVIVGLYFLYYRRPRPGPPQSPRWWQTRVAIGVLSTVTSVMFWLLLLFPFLGSRARRLRLLFLWIFGLTAFFSFVFLFSSEGDAISIAVFALLLGALAYGWAVGGRSLRPAGFGYPDGSVQYQAVSTPPAGFGPAYPPPPYAPNPPQYNAPQYSAPQYSAPQSSPAPAYSPPQSSPPVAYSPAPPAPAAEPLVKAQKPGTLPTFAQVGGMSALKAELGDTFGLLLAFAGEADAYRITFNGMLLHGPPGVGKTFIAKATAGEFGLTFLHVAAGDLISKYVGESARNIKAVFAEAARNVPCVLFFDEFDSIAERRDENVNEESKRVVNQLLQSLEEWRSVRDLVVMAATNHLDQLDPAVVRAGRFDRHIRVDLPDLEARRAIISAQLRGRPVSGDIEVEDLAQRTAGRTPATITRIIESAALSAFRAATESGTPIPITEAMLRTALDGLGGADRPTVEDWTWDRLVLSDKVKAELRQVQALVADPDLATRYGVAPPSGLLLAGPPGTGKTTVARVFAAQAGCSFYPITAADLTSKWVGESEASVVRLFARARENAPSIIFVDEVDAIASKRSEMGSGVLDRTLTQLLSEIDGMTEQRGVFVMAATNRPETLDPALVRGGRLSRTIWIPLPDVGERAQLLRLFGRSMPIVDVDLDSVAANTEGYSGADLEALCQQAALEAMLQAQRPGAAAHVEVNAAAFATAMADRATSKRRTAGDDADAPEAPPLPPHVGGYL